MTSAAVARKATTTAVTALSLSGVGHLLPYHLGVCQALLAASKQGNFPHIHSISGSSAGAIAAVVATRGFSSPSVLIADFCRTFIQERGNALKTLEVYLTETLSKEPPRNNASLPSTTCIPELYICTTKCRDGSVHLFPGNELNDDELLRCVRASCTIPRSFHPLDVLASSSSASYPDSDGVLIQGEYHVDGGIAGPAPPVPNLTENEGGRLPVVIVVSPISGSPSGHDNSYRISPRDNSFAMPFWKELKCRGDFHVRPSLQNLTALRVASGSTTSSELQSWYERGMADASDFIVGWDEQNDKGR